jgi:phosphatidylinositol alpha-mannosyltransferase
MARPATAVYPDAVKRVALISPYALSVFGGVQEQVLAMSRELSRRDVEVLIVAPDARDDTTYDTPARVTRFGRRVAMPANGSRAPLTLSPGGARAARAAVSAFAPDVVHFHEPFAPLVGWATLRAHTVPSVATFHRSGHGPALSLTGPLLRELAKGIDVAVSVSPAAHATVRRAVGIDSDVLFNGFETERFVTSPRRRGDEVLLLSVGRLEERKGVATAIEAVRHHNESAAQLWRLVIVGDGPEREKLRALAGGDEQIVFVGAVSDDEKRGWLRRASLFLAPATHGESFGLVLLEAMASECSVVASDIEGYQSAAGGHATLFRAGDPRALATAIELALRSESDASVAAARQHAESWSMRRLMDAYLERYERAHQHFYVSR